MFGDIESIEFDGPDVALITFKESRSAYLTILHFGMNIQAKSYDIQIAALKDQPTTPRSTSILDLAGDTLLKIFTACSIHDQIALLKTCKKFHKIVKENIFDETESVSYGGHNILEGIDTACSLMKISNAKTFKLMVSQTFKRKFNVFFYEITFNLNHMKRILEMDLCTFNTYVNHLSSMTDRFEALRIWLPSKNFRCNHTPQILGSSNALLEPRCDFRNINRLSIIGIDKFSLPLIRSLEWLPHLTSMSFEYINFRGKIDLCRYIESSNSLRRIILLKCSFENQSQFFHSLVRIPSTEKLSIELMYDEISFEESDNDDIDSVNI